MPWGLADAELQAPGGDHSLSFRAAVVALPAHPRTLSWQPPAIRQPGGDTDAQGQHGQEGQCGSDSTGIFGPSLSPTALRLVVSGSRRLFSGTLGTNSANHLVPGVRALWPLVRPQGHAALSAPDCRGGARRSHCQGLENHARCGC